jgi:hypothetical protein
MNAGRLRKHGGGHRAGSIGPAAMVVAAAILVPCPPATAQEFPATTEDPREAAARVHYDRASKLYDAGNLTAAILELRRAHELRPTYRIQRTIAEVAEELHDYAAAVRAYERFLRDGEDLVDASDRSHVLSRIAELRTFVAFLRVQAAPADARVTVDGDLVSTAPSEEPWIVNVGRRYVEVEKEGYMPFRRAITVTAGESVLLRASLELGARPAAPPVRPSPPAASVEAPGQVPALTWVGFGAAGTLLATGAVTGVLALRADDRARTTPFTGASVPESVQRDLDKANTLALATDLLVGAGVGVALVTSYFTWWAPSGGPSQPGSAARVNVSPHWASIEGSF